MAKRWSDVIASPDYQQMNAQDKANAQSQYFDQVVKPQLPPDQVEAAHTQFYNQYPIGSTPTAVGSQASQEAPQEAQAVSNTNPQPTTPEAATEPQSALERGFNAVGETAAGMGRIAAGIPVSLANAGIGVINTIGEGVQQASNAITGEQGQYTPIARAGYGSLDPVLAPRGVEQIGSDIGATMLAAPAMGAEMVAAEGAPLVARLGTALGRNAAASVVPTMAQHTTGQDSSEALKDMAINTLAGTALEGVGNKAIDLTRRALPESLGGYSAAQRAAEVVNPDYLARVLQGGDTEAQQVFRTATTDEAGNSILNPSQVLNPTGGKKYIAAEQRSLARGSDSPYAQNLEAQASGEGITRAVGDTVAEGENSTLQQAAQDITAAHRAEMNRVYNTSKQGAQEILDSANIKQLKLPQTKSLAIQHLEDNAAAGNIKLTRETRQALKQFAKEDTKLKNVTDIDDHKRLFNELRGKAIRSGDYTSANVLGEMVDSLRGETDNLLTQIHPQAGSLYRDADRAFGETVEDYGKKSILARISNTANPDVAANAVLNGQNARYNAQQVVEALQRGNIPEAQALAEQLGQGIGESSRQYALNAATSGENFSPTKFVNRLNQYEPQAQLASQISPRNESGINQALSDSVRATRDRATVSTATRDNVINGLTRLAGGSAGAAVAGPGGAVVGQEVAARVATGLKNSGLLDKFANKQGAKYVNYLSDPTNAAKVDEILQASKGKGIEAASKREVTNIIDNLKRAGIVAGVNNTIGGEDYSNPYQEYEPYQPQTTQPAPVTEPEPEQRAQSAKKDRFEGVSPQAINLYDAVSDAETGGLDNRWIRTKAPESGLSTAWGPAQLTGTLAKDFLNNKPLIFTEEERDYLKRFVAQAEKFKKADDSDPVYGYGGVGELTSDKDKELYEQVNSKMMDDKYKSSKSLDKAVIGWRGNSTDSKYFERVREGYKKAKAKRQGWTK
ncbi:hypothetical protein IFY90_004258 [Salmonella enterica]|nr:hypothetical protein [Salmonella enterica]